jgi:hypothetical protein
MNVFRNETHDVKILVVSNYFACGTWMCRKRGEGEEEIENQGWSRVKVTISFSSQGTDLKGQWSLRMSDNKAERTLSTGCTKDSNSTPLFFSSKNFASIA